MKFASFSCIGTDKKRADDNGVEWVVCDITKVFTTYIYLITNVSLPYAALRVLHLNILVIAMTNESTFSVEPNVVCQPISSWPSWSLLRVITNRDQR